MLLLDRSVGVKFIVTISKYDIGNFHLTPIYWGEIPMPQASIVVSISKLSMWVINMIKTKLKLFIDVLDQIPHGSEE